MTELSVKDRGSKLLQEQIRASRRRNSGVVRFLRAPCCRLIGDVHAHFLICSSIAIHHPSFRRDECGSRGDGCHGATQGGSRALHDRHGRRAHRSHRAGNRRLRDPACRTRCRTGAGGERRCVRRCQAILSGKHPAGSLRKFVGRNDVGASGPAQRERIVQGAGTRFLGDFALDARFGDILFLAPARLSRWRESQPGLVGSGSCGGAWTGRGHRTVHGQRRVPRSGVFRSPLGSS